MASTNPQAMDVDGPSNGPGTLKRCSSAPMINETSNAAMATAAPSSSASRDGLNLNIFGTASQTRTRRFSASFSPVPGSPISARLTPRINQLRQEENEVNSRELAHEREVHSAMQISQSWEDLRLMGEPAAERNGGAGRLGPLHVQLPPSSPSPTRWGCGAGFQSPTRSRAFVRRSESPVLRPSPLGAKRKLDEGGDLRSSPRAKRVYSYSAVERGLLTTSNQNSLPGSLSSVGTPESLSSADSPGFGFRNVDSPSPTRGNHQEPMIVAKNDHDMSEGPS